MRSAAARVAAASLKREQESVDHAAWQAKLNSMFMPVLKEHYPALNLELSLVDCPNGDIRVRLGGKDIGVACQRGTCDARPEEALNAMFDLIDEAVASSKGYTRRGGAIRVVGAATKDQVEQTKSVATFDAGIRDGFCDGVVYAGPSSTDPPPTSLVGPELDAYDAFALAAAALEIAQEAVQAQQQVYMKALAELSRLAAKRNRGG
jgi:hypothetical protein